MDVQKEYEAFGKLVEEMQKDTQSFIKDPNQDFTIQEIEDIIKKFEYYIQKINEKASFLASEMNISKDEFDEISKNLEKGLIKEFEPLVELKNKVDEFKNKLTKEILNRKDQLQVKKELEEKHKHKLSSGRKNWIPS
jgi:hypothetical protein